MNPNPEPKIPIKGKAALEEEFDLDLLPENLYRVCSTSRYYKMRSKLDFKEYLLKEQIANDEMFKKCI